jgi:HAD superfamily hydrolase (TIGR01509 family)
MRPIRGVILDIDGTLVNSNDAHARAWVSAFAETGFYLSFNTVRQLIGMGGDKLMPAVANVEEDSELGQRISQRRSEIFRTEHLPSLRAFPKTRELLSRLRGAGLKLAVASSAKREELEPLLELAAAKDLVEDVTSSSDAESSKPDPDIVEAALRALGFEASRVLMLGDTPYDIAAAGDAGISTIALRCGGRSDHDLSGAIAIYDDPEDLLARLETSPLLDGG